MWRWLLRRHDDDERAQSGPLVRIARSRQFHLANEVTTQMQAFGDPAEAVRVAGDTLDR